MVTVQPRRAACIVSETACPQRQRPETLRPEVAIHSSVRPPMFTHAEAMEMLRESRFVPKEALLDETYDFMIYLLTDLFIYFFIQ